MREAIKLRAAMAPTLAQSIEVARGQAPVARQDPTTPFNLMGHIFLNVHEGNRETSRDAQPIHVREEGVHRAADAADETVTVWSHTGHITVRGKLASL